MAGWLWLPSLTFGWLMKREIASKLDRLLLGKRYISVQNGLGENLILLIKELELKDRVWIDFIYEQAIEEGRSRNLMSSNELAIFLDKTGVWTKSDDKDIQNIKISLSKIKEKLKEDLTKREIISINRIKDSIEKELRDKEILKSAHFSSSLETNAESQKLNAIVFCSTFNEDETRYWDSWDTFGREMDTVLIGNITNKIFTKDHINTKEMREIARSSDWRFKWVAYKNSGDLFNKPLVELTQDQQTLIYWSQVYDMAYESMDRPAQEIIDDDEQLDKWFEEQSRKQKQKQVEEGKNNKIRMTKHVSRHGEVGIVTGPLAEQDFNRAKKLGYAKSSDVPTTEEIFELNDALAKKFKLHQTEKLKKHGSMEERDLRSDPNSRRVINSEDHVWKKARRRDGFTGKQVIEKKQGGTLMDGMKGRKQ